MEKVWIFEKPFINGDIKKIIIDEIEYAVAILDNNFHIYKNGKLVFENKSFNNILKELDKMSLNYKLTMPIHIKRDVIDLLDCEYRTYEKYYLEKDCVVIDDGEEGDEEYEEYEEEHESINYKFIEGALAIVDEFIGEKGVLCFEYDEEARNSMADEYVSADDLKGDTTYEFVDDYFREMSERIFKSSKDDDVFEKEMNKFIEFLIYIHRELTSGKIKNGFWINENYKLEYD